MEGQCTMCCHQQVNAQARAASAVASLNTTSGPSLVDLLGATALAHAHSLPPPSAHHQNQAQWNGATSLVDQPSLFKPTSSFQASNKSQHQNSLPDCISLPSSPSSSFSSYPAPPFLDAYCAIVLKDLAEYGFCVIDNFLPTGDAVFNEVLQLYGTGLFTAGQLAQRQAGPLPPSGAIRNDRVVWLRGNEPDCSAIGNLVHTFDSIVRKCSKGDGNSSNSNSNSSQLLQSSNVFTGYDITSRTKAMVACYPGNYSKYVRHVDNPNGDGRCLTCIYYLNKDYDRKKHGGVLRIFPTMNEGIVADIEPRFNRAIFFWSDRRNPHEVLPSTRLRFAITVWYIDAKQRDQTDRQTDSER